MLTFRNRILICMLSFGYLFHGLFAQAIIINHNYTDITLLSEARINNAKAKLHIAYGHTSHGSQITSGMTGLVSFANGGGKGLVLPNDIFDWNNGGTNGALDLHDYAMGGDVGYYPQWYNNTITYLGSVDTTGRGTTNSDVNVIIWSWCGQVDSKYASGTLYSEYLEPMQALENSYTNVKFVYMTGHVDHWDDANNKAANDSIRRHCMREEKTLYDFADIESYDPDSTFYEYPHDNCDYYDSPTGSALGNWALEWQITHVEDLDWYSCSSAHSQPLNANQKAYAAWWLWALIAEYEFTLSVRVQVKIFLEGPYNDTSNEMSTNLTIPTTSPYSEDARTIASIPSNITDWVLVQLRSTVDGSAVASKSALLHKDGRIVADDGSTEYIVMDACSGDYYIVIKHRNHVAVESKTARTLSFDSSTLYNFTVNASVACDKYLGDEAADLEAGIYGMFTGDFNKNGEITTEDYTPWYNDARIGASGYQTCDIDMDGEVTTSDYTKWYNNARIGASSNVPNL